MFSHHRACACTIDQLGICAAAGTANSALSRIKSRRSSDPPHAPSTCIRRCDPACSIGRWKNSPCLTGARFARHVDQPQTFGARPTTAIRRPQCRHSAFPPSRPPGSVSFAPSTHPPVNTTVCRTHPCAPDRTPVSASEELAHDHRVSSPSLLLSGCIGRQGMRKFSQLGRNDLRKIHRNFSSFVALPFCPASVLLKERVLLEFVARTSQCILFSGGQKRILFPPHHLHHNL